MLSAIPWWAASLIANFCIMGVEYLNHVGGYGSYWQTLLRTGPLIIVAQWGLYRAFSESSHWLTAWAVFTLGNAVMRVVAVSTFTNGQVGSLAQVCVGVAIMIGGSLVLKGGLR